MSSPSGMVAFQIINLNTDFEFDDFYSESLFSEIAEAFHDLGTEGINIFEEKNNSLIFEKLNPLFNPEGLKPNPIGLLLFEARKGLKIGDHAYNYLIGESNFQNMKDFITDTIEFTSDAVLSPITDGLKNPILFVLLPVALSYLIFKMK